MTLLLFVGIIILISNLTAAVVACWRMWALCNYAVLRGKEVGLLFGRGGGDVFFVFLLGRVEPGCSGKDGGSVFLAALGVGLLLSGQGLFDVAGGGRPSNKND